MRLPARRVLLVEDDVIIRTDVADALREEGYVVDEANNGAHALERMRAALPDVVLLDLMAPVMNGWEFRKRQLSEPDLETVPVVVVSGVSELEHAQEELSASASVGKPFRIEELLDAVSRACGSR